MTVARVRVLRIAGFTAEVSVPAVAPGEEKSARVDWVSKAPRFDRDFDAGDRATYRRVLMEAIRDAR